MATNKYPGQCKDCGEHVAAGEGFLAGKVEGRWAVSHGTCPSPDEAPKASKEEHPPTDEQQAIFDAILRGENVVVQAGAGTGKTSTMVGAAKRLEQKLVDGRVRKGQMTAFNSAIVAEGALKFPGTVACNTVDSLAIRAFPEYKKALDVSTGKSATKKAPYNHEVAKALRVADLVLPTTDGNTKTLSGRVQVGIAKRTFTKFCQSADTTPGPQHVEAIAEIDEVQQEKLAARVLPITNEFWRRLQDPKDAWTAGANLIFAAVKKVWQLSKPLLPVDYIMFDEAQDASGVMMDVVAHNKEMGKQVIVVGDTQQSINEWAGAVDALPKFVALGATELYLTKSFRFGEKVAEIANNILHRLGAALVLVGFEILNSTVGFVDEPDCILTRTNAGAVRELIAQIKAGRRPHLAGKNAVKELRDLVDACDKLQRGERADHPELVGFSTWAEVQDYVQEDPSAGSMKVWVKLIDETGTRVIRDALASVVDAKVADVTISTAHKSKGMEWGTVRIAGDFFPPREGAEDLSPEELKLAYVAVTRAKDALDISRVPHFTKVGGNGSRFGTEFDEEGWSL